jgi:hypothetical protein
MFDYYLIPCEEMQADIRDFRSPASPAILHHSGLDVEPFCLPARLTVRPGRSVAGWLPWA